MNLTTGQDKDTDVENRLEDIMGETETGIK